MKGKPMNQVAWTFTALTLTAACHAYAQTGVPAEFPRKTIRLVATSSPGSPVDLFARAISDHLAKSFVQSVVIDNRVGAGGTLAAGIVLQAEADGHVMMVNTSAQVVAPFMYRKLPFDMLRDFAAIAPLAIQPNVLVISPQHGWKSVQELVAAAKAKPKGLSYGTGGSGTGTHMNAERFRLRAGIDAVQVPYKGSPEALVDVIAGRIDWSFLPVSTALAHMNDGRVRALALSGDRRSPKLPDLPTITESGLTDSDFPFWVGVFASSKTPRVVMQRLHSEIARATALPEVRKRIDNLGAEPMSMSMGEFDKYVREQADIAAGIIKAAGIQAN
jgi:tripartite-type tricarboxylate transporter receptor subunit TctC